MGNVIDFPPGGKREPDDGHVVCALPLLEQAQQAELELMQARIRIADLQACQLKTQLAAARFAMTCHAIKRAAFWAFVLWLLSRFA